MKKLAIITILATTAIAAAAADVTARYGSNFSKNRDYAGIAVGQRFGPVGAELAFDRSLDGDVNVNRYSALGSYDLVSGYGATVAVKGGGALTYPATGDSGFSWLVGAGVSYPLSKTWSATADYTYQKGQERVKEFDGNTVSLGLKYSF